MNRIICGNAAKVIPRLQPDSVDCVFTSPPYWGQRQYAEGGIGNEGAFADYLQNLVGILDSLRVPLKKTGSVWLNLGDKYLDYALLGLPWKVAFALQDLGWILRQEIIWYKSTGFTAAPQNRLRTTHEHIFHFVLARDYYWDRAAILRKTECKQEINDGSGYVDMIKKSPHLSDVEKANATRAVLEAAGELGRKEIRAFRLKLRGHHAMPRRGHINAINKTGYVLVRSSHLTVPSNVFDIYTGNEQSDHPAQFPLNLPKVPIKATCPQNGTVLDPFMGSGTTCMAAAQLNRRYVGIDISRKYCKMARARLAKIQTTLEGLPQ